MNGYSMLLRITLLLALFTVFVTAEMDSSDTDPEVFLSYYKKAGPQGPLRFGKRRGPSGPLRFGKRSQPEYPYFDQ